MIEADNVLSAPAALPLDTDQLLRVDVVAIVRRVVACIPAAPDRGDHAQIAIEATEQHSTALVRVGLFPVLAKGGVVGSGDLEHGFWMRR